MNDEKSIVELSLVVVVSEEGEIIRTVIARRLCDAAQELCNIRRHPFLPFFYFIL
jgi:hypothetical protein